MGGEQQVDISPVVGLDGFSKAEVYAFRQSKVERYSALYEGTYLPRPTVFGGIKDGKPWWGMDGQFCHGAGLRSSEGPSEKSFHRQSIFIVGGRRGCCFFWFGSLFGRLSQAAFVGVLWTKATVQYDMTQFAKDVKKAKRKMMPSFFIHNTMHEIGDMSG